MNYQYYFDFIETKSALVPNVNTNNGKKRKMND